MSQLDCFERGTSEFGNLEGVSSQLQGALSRVTSQVIGRLGRHNVTILHGSG